MIYLSVQLKDIQFLSSLKLNIDIFSEVSSNQDRRRRTMAVLDGPTEQLGTAWKGLRARWEQTTPLWNDPVSQGFERNYLTLFESQTQTTLQEMQRLAQVIAEAQRRIH
jgi:uncharacterized protein YukE